MKSVMRSYCGGCYENRPFEKQRACHVLHLLLSIVTAGFWLPLWLLCGLSAALQPYRCRTCAKARWFQSSRREMEDAEIDALTDNLSAASRRYAENIHRQPKGNAMKLLMIVLVAGVFVGCDSSTGETTETAEVIQIPESVVVTTHGVSAPQYWDEITEIEENGDSLFIAGVRRITRDGEPTLAERSYDVCEIEELTVYPAYLMPMLLECEQ